MKRHRVLHLITHLGVGGAQDNTLVTVEGLNRERFEVHVAAAGGEWEGRARACSDHLILIPSLRREIFAASHARAFLDVFRLLRRQRYHIVHTHSTHAGILGRLAAVAARVPVIVHTTHGYPFDDLTLGPAMRAALVHIERLCARPSDRIVMVSALLKEQGLRLGIAPEHKMVVVYSGIDLTRFYNGRDPCETRRRLGLAAGRPVVGWVGRFSDQNAPEIFIEAARRIAALRPEVQFVMVGDGPLWPRCEALARDCPQLTLLGQRFDVPRLLPSFDLFVSTVRWAGLGRAVTEAMIAGRPVVATAVNGVPEIVRHGETGRLVRRDDVDAIVREVCYLLDCPDEARRLGSQARAIVAPHFSADLMVRRIEELYDELLRQKCLA